MNSSNPNTTPVVISPKSGLTAFLLCLFLGNLGVHRFYVGKIGTGILMILTGGGLGIWYLYDLISIVCNNFTDKQNRVVEIAKNQTAGKKVLMICGSIAAAFILFIGLGATIAIITTGKLADLGQDELAALRASDYNKAYSYTSADFQKAVTMDNFKKFVAQYPQLQSNVSASFTDRNMDDNTGSIKGKLTLKDGSTVPIEMDLVYENNAWKILSMTLKNVAQ